MPKQPKLSDLQLILLSTASGRADGSIFPIPDSLKSDGPRLDKSLRGLLTKKLVEEVDAAKPAMTWREEDKRRIGLSITDAGREAIAVEPEGGASGDAGKEPQATPPAPEKPATGVKAGTKQALLVEMLEREGGASLDEITAATSWLSVEESFPGGIRATTRFKNANDARAACLAVHGRFSNTAGRLRCANPLTGQQGLTYRVQHQVLQRDRDYSH
jgi:hypothetical protein